LSGLWGNSSGHVLRGLTPGNWGRLLDSITLEQIAAIKIPLPPLTLQKIMVKEFNRYEKLIASQNEAVNFFYEQCQKRVRLLWG
jgi:hypothetical protein